MSRSGWSATRFPGRLRTIVLAACAAAAALAVAGPAAAEGRAALVVAEAAYPDSDAVLPTPVGDAGAMAEALRRRGFTVTTADNAGRDTLKTAVDRFVRTVEPDGVALVFFAGYGIQVGRRNYLIPLDARVWSESDVARDGISVDGLMDALAKRQAGIRALILDASRRNPFERRFRSFSQGLAPIPAPPGVIALSAAAAGGVVGDGAGPRSPFVTELVRQIATDASVDKAFEAVRDAMAKRGPNVPPPAITSDLRETFFFDPDRPRVAMAAPPAPEPKAAPPAAPKPPVAKPDESETRPEREREQATRDFQTAERAGTAAAYRDFLKRHPTGPLTEKANAAQALAEAAERKAEARRAEQDEQQKAELRRDEERREEQRRADSRKEEERRADLRKEEEERRADPRKDEEQRRGEQERQRLAELDDRIRRDPRDEGAYYERGQFHAQRGDTAAAIADFDRAIRLNPASPEAYNNRCWLHAVAGDLRRARSDCDEALRLRPGFLDALDSRGLVNLKSGALQAAVSDYGEALKRDARHSSALYGRGLALKRLGDEATGGRDMTSAFALNPQIDKEFATYGVR
ncbi:caspase family protein [Methylobacterium sp. J-070]|uniref:caspase family protein n=1 Tax=Methylobacterium sp. J-070 TaxID=2836650 RepID=UPI001FB93E64|nr:caspase family protein [Methylobacterium sp. J-070]MCJ2050491.1 caspase family protein [Methylobacterium sp. J-070]